MSLVTTPASTRKAPMMSCDGRSLRRRRASVDNAHSSIAEALSFRDEAGRSGPFRAMISCKKSTNFVPGKIRRTMVPPSAVDFKSLPTTA